MKKILNYKYATLACLILFIFFAVFITSIGAIITNIFTIKGIVNNGYYNPVNVTIINIKNSSFDIPNEIYFMYNFYFYYNNTIKNISVVCRDKDCLVLYGKYKINDNIVVYPDADEFKFNTNISELVADIILIPFSIFGFIILACVSIGTTSAIFFKLWQRESYIDNKRESQRQSKEYPIEIQLNTIHLNN